jgi:hypothetical protein
MKNKKLIVICAICFLAVSIIHFNLPVVDAATYYVTIAGGVSHPWLGSIYDLDNVNTFNINTTNVNLGVSGSSFFLKFDYAHGTVYDFVVEYTKQYIGSTFYYSLSFYEFHYSGEGNIGTVVVFDKVTYDVTKIPLLLFFDNSTDTVYYSVGTVSDSYVLHDEITENCVGTIYYRTTDDSVTGGFAVEISSVDYWSINSYTIDFSGSDFSHGDIFIDVYESEDLILSRFEISDINSSISIRGRLCYYGLWCS